MTLSSLQQTFIIALWDPAFYNKPVTFNSLQQNVYNSFVLSGFYNKPMTLSSFNKLLQYFCAIRLLNNLVTTNSSHVYLSIYLSSFPEEKSHIFFLSNKDAVLMISFQVKAKDIANHNQYLRTLYFIIVIRMNNKTSRYFTTKSHI